MTSTANMLGVYAFLMTLTLISFSAADKVASAASTPHLWPRQNNVIWSGSLTSESGVSTLIPFIDKTHTVIVTPSITSIHTSVNSSVAKPTSSANNNNTSSATASEQSRNVTAQPTQGKHFDKPDIVAIAVPATFVFGWALFCIIYWRVHRRRPHAIGDEGLHVVPVVTSPLPEQPEPTPSVVNSEVYVPEMPKEVRGTWQDFREREKQRVSATIAAMIEQQKALKEKESKEISI